jgi:hypothetical protein
MLCDLERQDDILPYECVGLCIYTFTMPLVEYYQIKTPEEITSSEAPKNALAQYILHK